jgi:hypothetical protein
MRLLPICCFLSGLAAVAGCSRMETSPCEPDVRYSAARSAPPVQIPDDLSPPDESDALRLPPDVGGSASLTAGECLETPPSFFGESRPFEVTSEDDEERGESRRERRERRRAEREAGEVPANEPAPAPEADDRVIDN